MAADTRALVRVLSELSWTLRREGFAIAPSQAVDIARAVVLLGFERKSDVRDAMAAIVGVRPRERALFDTTFDAFFDAGSRLGLDERLMRAGATPEEREMIRSFLDVLADSHDDTALVALLEGGGELARLLSAKGTRELVATADSSLRSGVVIHRVIERLGYKRAYDELAELNVEFDRMPASKIIQWAVDSFGPYLSLAASMADALVIDLATKVEPGIEVVFIAASLEVRGSSETGGPGP